MKTIKVKHKISYLLAYESPSFYFKDRDCYWLDDIDVLLEVGIAADGEYEASKELCKIYNDKARKIVDDENISLHRKVVRVTRLVNNFCKKVVDQKK